MKTSLLILGILLSFSARGNDSNCLDQILIQQQKELLSPSVAECVWNHRDFLDGFPVLCSLDKAKSSDLFKRHIVYEIQHENLVYEITLETSSARKNELEKQLEILEKEWMDQGQRAEVIWSMGGLTMAISSCSNRP